VHENEVHDLETRSGTQLERRVGWLIRYSEDMTRRRLAISASLIMATVLVAGISFLIGNSYAIVTTSVRQVTPGQLANAMEKDDFYSQYRGATLLVRGIVSSVNRHGRGAIVGFKTKSTFQASCVLGTYPSTIHRGSAIAALSEAAAAERLSSTVVLTNCILLRSSSG
jgi:hypothetical protein